MNIYKIHNPSLQILQWWCRCSCLIIFKYTELIINIVKWSITGRRNLPRMLDRYTARHFTSALLTNTNMFNPLKKILAFIWCVKANGERTGTKLNKWLNGIWEAWGFDSYNTINLVERKLFITIQVYIPSCTQSTISLFNFLLRFFHYLWFIMFSDFTSQPPPPPLSVR